MSGWEFLDKNRDWLTGIVACVLSIIALGLWHQRFDGWQEVQELATLAVGIFSIIGGVRLLERKRKQHEENSDSSAD